MAIINELLSLSVVTGIVSRIAAPGDVLQRAFGVQIGGPNITPVSGRSYSYDIFDVVRDSAKGRRPGTGPAVVAPNPVGKQNQTIPRQYEKLPLTYELLHNLRALGENAGIRDTMGKKYIDKQAAEMKRRCNNFRELIMAGLLTKGLIYFRYDGDDLIPTMTSPSTGDTMDFLIPAGNKTKLDMLGAGDIIATSWDNAAAPIPTDIFQINEAFMALTGEMLAHVWLPSPVWMNVLKNTDVRNLAGSANKPFATFDTVNQAEGVNENGKRTSLLEATLAFCPWVKWHVYDGYLNDDGTLTRLLPVTQATFTIEPDGQWFRGVEGSEPVKVNPMAPVEEAFGFASWVREWDEPARYELHTLQNWLPELNRPKGIAIGLVVY